MRTLRFIGWLVIPGCIILGGIGGANAQSEELQQACTPDAMRLCHEFIPDREKITRCMMAKRSQISAPCRSAMRTEGQRRRKEAGYHHRRVHYGHREHYGHHARHKHHD